MLATALTGCQPEQTAEEAGPGEVGDTRLPTSETPDARRQTTGGEPGTTGETRPPTSETSDARQTPEEPTTTAVPVRVIEVIERAGWGAAPAGAGMEEHVVERLTIHHTGVPLEDNRLAPARLRAHQVFHQKHRGWPDLAYHFAIDQAGNVYEGRPPEFRGDTATSYDPTGHFLVVLEGNFDVEPTTEAQVGSLTDLLAWGARHYGLDPTSISGHRDHAETSCPGDAVYDMLTSGFLATEVAVRVGKGGINLVILGGEEAAARVRLIESGG